MADAWEYPAAGAYGAGARMPESVEVDARILEERVPKVLLMGARRSGKSSIYRVLFSKMSPHETLFLESTTALEISRIANSKLLTYQVWDFPGDFDPRGEFYYGNAVVGPAKAYGGPTALVMCVDAQEDDLESMQLQRVVETAKIAAEVNPRIQLHIFIHKVDGGFFQREDEQVETMDSFHKVISDQLEENDIHISVLYNLTSIYDNSISESFSKVVQSLIPSYSVLETLLNTLNANCNIKKSFIFDVMSKLYYATDSNPVDLQTHELCSDMIDVVIDISSIYGLVTEVDGRVGVQAYDAASASAIKLSNGLVLYLREVSTSLALVCVVDAKNFKKRGLIDYNIDTFKQALSEIFDA